MKKLFAVLVALGVLVSGVRGLDLHASSTVWDDVDLPLPVIPDN